MWVHFSDTAYYPSLDYLAGRPYGVWVHGNNDTIGAATSVEKVATGLSLTQVADVLEIVGSIDAEVRPSRPTSWAARSLRP